MHSRPLLDYLAYPEQLPEPMSAAGEAAHQGDPLEARLKDLETRLRANDAAAALKQDVALSAQVEAILRRQGSPQDAVSSRARQAGTLVEAPRPARMAIEPPPTVPVPNDVPVLDQEFLKFTEAVYLIGQAARRFIEQPQAQPQAQAQPVARQSISNHGAPSAVEIEALSAVLRETVSAFRSVADDLAVSAGEIRNFATRDERQPAGRRSQPAHRRDDDEIMELRDSIAALQDRLDDLLHARRRSRY